MKGLHEQIKSATSKTEVESLLLRGNQFDMASNKTRRKWGRAATARIAALK